MIELNFEQLATKTAGTLKSEKFAGNSLVGISIDTRTIGTGELFAAIRGEQNDGHNYLRQAMEKNCAGLLVDSEFSGIDKWSDNIPTVVVADTHEALKKLAADHIKSINTFKIGVTGSNGKTTTKDFIFGLIKNIIDSTYCSPGNLNNLFGLPLSIFQMPQNTLFAIFEMGISEPGEMKMLTEIMTPDAAIITNVGPTHLETLGSVEGVAQAKLEMADAMNPDAPLLVNADDPVLMKAIMNRQNRFVTFGIDQPADFGARSLGIDNEGYPVVEIDGEQVTLKLFGEHQIYNLLAAYAMAKTVGIEFNANDFNSINYNFAQYRGEIEHFNRLTIIADCYNANPASMKSALDSFQKYLSMIDRSNHRAIVILGDMLELGENQAILHGELGSRIAKTDFDLVITVGVMAAEIAKQAIDNGFDSSKISHFENVERAGENLVKILKEGDIIFLKASRGIGLEKIITYIKEAA